MQNQQKQNLQRLTAGTLHQQNLIEMFGYIFRERWTTEGLVHEMSKSPRTIQRMVKDINELYPCITNRISDRDGKGYFSVIRDFNEKELDRRFLEYSRLPLLYIFIATFLCRPLSLQDIMHKTGVNQKGAIQIFNDILDTTSLVDTIEYKGQTYLGATDFLERLM